MNFKEKILEAKEKAIKAGYEGDDLQEGIVLFMNFPLKKNIKRKNPRKTSEYHDMYVKFIDRAHAMTCKEFKFNQHARAYKVDIVTYKLFKIRRRELVEKMIVDYMDRKIERQFQECKEKVHQYRKRQPRIRIEKQFNNAQRVIRRKRREKLYWK